MNVLVVGGVRFIGRRLVSELTSRGDKVTVLARGNNRPDLPAGVTTIWGDRNDRRVIEQALSANRFDVVFDNNAYDGDGVSMLLAAAEGKIGRYVLTSTAWIYALAAPSENQVVTESFWPPDASVSVEIAMENLRPLELPAVTENYLLGKQSAEKAAWSSGSDVTVLRAAMVSGLHDHNRRISFFVNGGRPNVGDMKKTFQLLWVNDLVAAMIDVLLLPSDGPSVFNIAPDERISPVDIVRWVETVAPRTANNETAENAEEPFTVQIPGHVDSSRFLKARPSFRFTKAETWIKDVAEKLSPRRTLR